jgi:N-acetylated-alpha-linked acidic dipeptidase
VEELAEEQRKEADRINSLLAAKTYALALDPAKSFGPPAAKKPVPHFNFAELKNAMERLAQVSESLDSALLPGEVSATVLAQVNRQLYMSERALTAESGLPGRQWYRHQIYAPGFYTGYGVKTLPRIREAIEAELYTTVDAEIALTAAVLFAFADHLDGIEALLQEPSAD